MNRIALLSLLFSLLTVFVACEDKSISLGFNTQNPTPENYELKSSLHVLLDVPKNVPVEMQQSMSAKVEVLVHSELLAAYDDGTGRFMLRVDSANYSSDNRSVEETDHIQRYLKTQLVQYKMGSDGEMSSVRFDEMVALPDVGDIDIRRIFLKVQPVLPSSPLAVGDTWERQQMLTDDNNKQSVVYKWFKLEEVFDRDGVKIAKLRMNVRYKQNSEDDAQTIRSAIDYVVRNLEVQA